MKGIRDRVVVQIDATVFERDIGDIVRANETLGELGGHPVKTPFDAVIENILFNPRRHSLMIPLLSKSR